MNRDGRCIAIRTLGDRDTVFCRRAGDFEQDHECVRVQLPQRRHALAAFEFFQFGVDASHALNQADERARNIGAKAFLLEEACIVGFGFGRS